jgi:hypothetical protein
MDSLWNGTHDVALPKPYLTKLRHARRLLKKPVNNAESSADSSAVRSSPEMASQLTFILSVEAVTKEKNSFLLNFIGGLKKSINQARVFSLISTSKCPSVSVIRHPSVPQGQCLLELQEFRNEHVIGRQGILSLAICKPAIRSTARRGNIILGFAANSLYRKNCLVYVARVTRKLEGRKYSSNSR